LQAWIWLCTFIKGLRKGWNTTIITPHAGIKEGPMTTIIPEGKQLRMAVEWIEENLRQGGEIKNLLKDVGMRFNLGPEDERYLYRLYLEKDETAS
jgi:hypothetical protein